MIIFSVSFLSVGVPYSKYKRFQTFMDYMSNRMHTATLIPEVVPSVPGLDQMLGKFQVI